jgi:putative N6-adenine-specific DNA methylase
MSNLKYDFPNWDIGVITSAQNFESSFKHQTSSVKTIKAGNLDTKFYIYKSKKA